MKILEKEIPICQSEKSKMLITGLTLSYLFLHSLLAQSEISERVKGESTLFSPRLTTRLNDAEVAASI